MSIIIVHFHTMDSIEIVWIYYGFSGAIVNFKVWISHFSPVTQTNGNAKDMLNFFLKVRKPRFFVSIYYIIY